MAWWIFHTLVITAALAAVVATVCRIGRIGPVGRHALWVLVLVKFVTPPVVVWPWAVPDPFGVARLDTPAAVRPLPLARSPEPTAVAAIDDASPSPAGRAEDSIAGDP